MGKLTDREVERIAERIRVMMRRLALWQICALTCLLYAPFSLHPDRVLLAGILFAILHVGDRS